MPVCSSYDRHVAFEADVKRLADTDLFDEHQRKRLAEWGIQSVEEFISAAATGRSDIRKLLELDDSELDAVLVRADEMLSASSKEAMRQPVEKRALGALPPGPR